MKNLKRLLCLALTGVMLSGMMVMGASAADFGDADKIVNTEAVDTMVALNIINGKPDGNYDPEGLVTRAEMAKMIATAVNGGVAPEFGTKPQPTYTDIKGNWAEQFIEYCADMKYISGRGNGVFDPAGNVTGVEAAKMVLTALGYNEDAYQLKGADWAINTNAIAVRTCKPSLYENLNGVNMNVAITRDTAAQIIWNGVQNHIVEWTPNREVTGTGLNYTYTINDEVTLLNKAYDAYIWVGTFNGNEKFGISGLSKGEIQVEGALENADRTKPGWAKKANFPAEYDIANIGEETKVIFKDGKTGPKKVLDRGDKIYGVFNTGASVVYNVTKNDIADGEDAKGKIKVAGTVYDVADAGLIMTDYIDKNKATWSTAVEGAGKIEGLKAVNGDTVKLIANAETGRIESAYVVETKLAVVTSANADKITMNNQVGTVAFENNDVEDGLKKDDVVAVTRYYDTDAEDGYTIVKKAEVVTGDVDGYKNKANAPATKQTVTVDGTAYKIYNESSLLKTSALDKAIDNFTGSHIGETVNLYLANGYVYFANQVSSSATNYSVVLEAKNASTTNSAFNKLELSVMNGEGEKAIITVSEDTKKSDIIAKNDGETDAAYATRLDGIALNSDLFPRGSIITYDLDKKGEALIYMKAKFDKADTTGVTYNKDTKVLNDIVTDPDCVVFVNIKNEALETSGSGSSYAVKGEIKAYKVRDLGSISKPGNAYAQVLNGDNTKVLAAVLDLKESPNGAASNRVYGIVSNYGGTVKVDGVAYTKFTVDVNDEQHTLYMKANAAGMAEGSIVTFEPVSDNIYTDTVAKAAGAVNSLSTTGNVVDVLSGGLFVKENNEADNTLTVTNALQGKTSSGINTTKPSLVASYVAAGTPHTYVINSDTKFYYVNQDKDNGLASGSVEEFDEINGYANVMVLWELTGTTKFAKAVIAETSGKAHIVAPAKVTETPTLVIAAGTDTTLTGGTLSVDSATNAFTGTYAYGKTGNVKFTETGLSAAEATVTVNGAEVKLGTDVQLTTGEYVVKVTVKQTGMTSNTFTYNLDLTLNQDAAPANP